MIALTGGTGFIGSYLTEKMPSVRRLVRNVSKVRANLDYCGDLLNQFDIEHILKDTECLIHLACTNNPRSSDRDVVSDVQQNLIGSIQLFQTYARLNPKGHIIFSSSGGAIYDPELPRIPRLEEDRLSPWSSYGVHKQAAEEYLKLISRETGVGATVLRISNPYGRMLPCSRAHGLIGVAVSTALAQGELPILGSDQIVRDYLHLDDLVQAIRVCIESVSAEKNKFRIYNVGSGEAHTIRDVLNLIETAMHRPLQTKVIEEPIKCSWNILNVEKIKSELGWRPRVGLENGIQNLIESVSH